ncbi:hypothetical protein SCLCIDRAFT_887942 [Scleroderma citrinum Foug A]|uniref:Uncharacterized protein n=1 Tax=Scleroderma citrinum Foug A TaxID=1036808 RepID=A0A0C3AUM6_9AGAM|nr:hypothetical protein SCLCIDRAFT_887942 [Scleroderma citrinum Foug A]
MLVCEVTLPVKFSIPFRWSEIKVGKCNRCSDTIDGHIADVGLFVMASSIGQVDIRYSHQQLCIVNC